MYNNGDLRRKILDFNELATIRARHPSAKIVHCHGVFDVIHAGHLAYFESAKKRGDKLVVTITTDIYVNKGPGRPYFPGTIRATMVAALQLVDYVAINPHPTAVTAIEAIRPDFYVKGPDYRDMAADITGGILKEEQAVQKFGGKLVFTDDDTHSSSNLINGYFKIWNDEQQAAIEQVQKAGGLSAIEQALEKISQQTVRVIGEPIVDTYVFCLPESISSKSPSISAKYQYEEDYAGGSLAIANHLCDFAKEVSLVTTHGGESYFAKLLESKLDSRVTLKDLVLPTVPTPRKTRFITPDKFQRIFEVTHLQSDQWLTHSPEKFLSLLDSKSKDTDVSIVADFGHGLFEGSVLNRINNLGGFVGLNVQTNSSNLGFNPFTKHSKFSYLSVDTKEARVAFHDRFTDPLDLARRIRTDYAKAGISLSITLGPNGALHLPADSNAEVRAPAFTDMVVDATGAGDAFFAMTSMLVKVGCPSIIVPFVGNVFAGLKTKVIGNKFAVSRAQLTKAVTSILK